MPGIIPRAAFARSVFDEFARALRHRSHLRGARIQLRCEHEQRSALVPARKSRRPTRVLLRSVPAVAAGFSAACAEEWASSSTRSASATLPCFSVLSSLIKCMPRTRREPCRRSDAGFSGIPNWRRRCMRCHFNSSWNDSLVVICSEVFVCWPESQE